MKHILMTALTLAVGALCNTAAAQQLQTKLDSLSYTVGMSQSQGLTEYMQNRMGVDLNYLDDFIRGLNEGTTAGSDKQKAAYYAGIQIGQQIANQMMQGINKELFGTDSTQTISLDLFMQGFVSGVTGKNGLMTPDEAQQSAQRLMRDVKAEGALKEYGENKRAGEAFLAENAKKPDIHTLPGGVQYRVLKAGTGVIPTEEQKVKVHYEGRTLDGTVFDSSYKREQPTTFRCYQVIKGWTEALTNMPVGSTWEVFIPQELAYGERKQGNDIDPFSMLIFKIELIDIVE